MAKIEEDISLLENSNTPEEVIERIEKDADQDEEVNDFSFTQNNILFHSLFLVEGWTRKPNCTICMGSRKRWREANIKPNSTNKRIGQSFEVCWWIRLDWCHVKEKANGLYLKQTFQCSPRGRVRECKARYFKGREKAICHRAIVSFIILFAKGSFECSTTANSSAASGICGTHVDFRPICWH